MKCNYCNTEISKFVGRKRHEDACYMKLQNPPLMFKNFEKVVATGGIDMTQDEREKKIENNVENKNVL